MAADATGVLAENFFLVIPGISGAFDLSQFILRVKTDLSLFLLLCENRQLFAFLESSNFQVR